MTRTPDMVRLLDADPDLGALLSDARREQAERELIVRTHRLPVGPWDVSRLAGATADHVGLLILSGVLSRELIVADHVSAELLGPGDLVRPWQPASRAGLLPVDALWSVLSPLTVAVLDRRFAAEVARYPEVTATLFDRLSERSMRLATTQAISELARRPDGSWLLRGDPPDAESLARKPGPGGQRAQDLMRPARRFAREGDPE